MAGKSSSGVREVPKRRGKANEKAAICAFIVIMIHSCVVWMTVNVEKLEKGDIVRHCMYNSVCALPVMLFGAIITQFFCCLFVLIEERKYMEIRYDGNRSLLLKNCFQIFWTRNFVVRLVIFIVIVGLMIKSGTDSFDNYFLTSWLNPIPAIGVSIILYIFDFKTLSVVELSEIKESNVNVAQGLAWSYFTGYLKIILEDLQGTIKKDGKWKKEYENGNLQCKFYAIIPLNCKIPSKLGESEKHRGITFEGKLPTLYVDHAGVKDRPYVNSVYRIENEKGESHYAICEYVTIIDTLFQMSLYTEFDAQKRDDQCRLLVRKLTELIDGNEDFRNKCVIVPFSGADDGPLLRDVLLDKISG